MTGRSRSTEQQRADEMRARILRNTEAWRALMRPPRSDFDALPARLDRDYWYAPLPSRDPRGIEIEYEHRRRRFWSEYAHPGEILEHGRRCVELARHLVGLTPSTPV